MVYDIVGQRCFSERVELALKLIVRTIVEKAQRATTAGGIVNHFCHHRSTLIEKQFVTDSNLARRLHQHIPQPHFPVQFTEKKHFYLGIGLLLRAVQPGWKNLRVVKDKRIAVIEIVKHIAEIEEHGLFLLVLQRFPVFIGLVHVDRL